MRIHTMTLDVFFVYLAMGPERSLRAISERFGIPERDLWRRALRERWDERVEGYEVEIESMTRDELIQSNHQLWLGILVEVLSRLRVPSLLVGTAPLGTQLLVQLQRRRIPRVAP